MPFLQWAGDQADPPLPREVGPGPADQDQDSQLEIHQIHQVHEEPGQPGQRPRHLHRSDEGDGSRPADGGHAALVLVVEGAGGFALQKTQDVPGCVAALLQGHRGHPGQGPAAEGVGMLVVGHITQAPYPVLTGQAQVLLYQQPACPVPIRTQVGSQFVSAHTSSPNACLGGDGSCRGLDHARTDAEDFFLQADFDPQLLQALGRVLAQALGEGAQK